MPASDDKLNRALDCNGFPLNPGDLVEMTEMLDRERGGAQGIVTRVAPPNICFVQMEKKIQPGPGLPEIVAAAGFLWKLCAQGETE